MADMQLSCPIPVEDIQKSVEESHEYMFMDTRENAHQASPQYNPFQAMEEDLYSPDPSIIDSSSIQYNISNDQPLMVNFPVAATDSELALTSEMDNKLSLQPSEPRSDTEILKELNDFLKCLSPPIPQLSPAIPRAEELSIQAHGLDSMTQSPRADGMEEQYEGHWDPTYQPMDELEPLSPTSTEMSFPGIKRATNITHDHSYGTKENSLRGLDMNKDEDLHKGLDLAMEELHETGLMESFVDVKKSMTKRPPKNVQDSQEALKNSVRNRRYLLRELRYVRVVADIRKLPTDKLRQLVPRLVRFLYYQQDDPNRKGIYKVAPLDWPETKFFGDPCNRIAEGGRPRKDMIVEMSCELFTRYQKVHASMTEDSVKSSVEATN